METSRERIHKAISHVQPDVTPVNVYGFEDIQPWLDHFGARDAAELSQRLGVDAFPDAPPVYRGPPIPPGRDIWGASYSWTGARGAGYSAARGGYPLAGLTKVGQIDRYAWPRAEDFVYAGVQPILSAVPPEQPV